MKNFIYLCLLLGLFLFHNRSLSQVTWPIANQKEGSNIICGPNEVLGNEHNQYSLFIEGKKGELVVAPVSGTVTAFSYMYLKSLQYSFSFKVSNFSNDDKAIREQLIKDTNSGRNKSCKTTQKKTKKSIVADPKNFCLMICIRNPKIGKVYLMGFHNPRKKFLTGSKIKAGEVLGTIGYSYHSIEKPSVKLSRSPIADPLKIYGIKSGFCLKKADSKAANYKFNPSELKEDFKVYTEALLDVYPGMYDYITDEEVQELHKNIKAKITKEMTQEQFSQLIQQSISAMHDTHLNIVHKSIKRKGCKITPHTPVLMGLENDSIIIMRTDPKHQHLLGRRVITVDGVESQSLIPQVKTQIQRRKDGFIQSDIDFRASVFFFDIYKRFKKKKEGSTLNLTFTNGEKHSFVYKTVSMRNYKPVFKNPGWNKKHITGTVLNDSTYLLDINTFQLTEKEDLELEKLVNEAQKTGCKNMLVDLRYNGGGAASSLLATYAMFAQDSFRINQSIMVNSNSVYSSSHRFSNMGPKLMRFQEFTVEKNGKFYLPENELSYTQPNSKVHFDGRLFVIVNHATCSAASNFAALVHKHKRGTIVGQETGGTYYQLNANKFGYLLLPNTKLSIRIPLQKIVFEEKHDAQIPWGRGVMPDIPISLSLKQFSTKNDLFLDKVISLVNQD